MCLNCFGMSQRRPLLSLSMVFCLLFKVWNKYRIYVHGYVYVWVKGESQSAIQCIAIPFNIFREWPLFLNDHIFHLLPYVDVAWPALESDMRDKPPTETRTTIRRALCTRPIPLVPPVERLESAKIKQTFYKMFTKSQWSLWHWTVSEVQCYRIIFSSSESFVKIAFFVSGKTNVLEIWYIRSVLEVRRRCLR